MFLEICDAVKMNRVTKVSIRLRLFPFCLSDKEIGWLQALLPRSITTWAEMAQKILSKFYEAWERFNDLLQRCPQHGYQDWLQIQLFYNGLNGHNQTIIDATA